MFQRRPWELPENIVSFLRDYNKMYTMDSEKATLEFESVAKEITQAVEDYISPIRRIEDFSAPRGVFIQIFKKNNTFGIFSYYWEEKGFWKLKLKLFTTIRFDSTDQLRYSSIAEDVVIEGQVYDIRKDLEIYQEFYYTF